MVLSADLIAKFAKATKDGGKTDKEATLRGTAVVTENDDGSVNKYVLPDGSTGEPIPVSSVSNIKNGDRVLIMIKNHSAVITGNLSDPSTSLSEIEGILLDIDTLYAEKLSAEEAKLTYASIENLKATNAEIIALESAYGEFVNLTTESFAAVDAIIESLGTKYANIDFSNIGTAAMQYFYARSGLIKDVVVGDQTITGHLVGVTISGDLIEGNTIKAEKLVIKGDDGLFYKLNTDGLSVLDEDNHFDKNNIYPEDNVTNVEWLDDYSATVTTNGADELLAIYFWIDPEKEYVFSYEGENCEVAMYDPDWNEVLRSPDSKVTEKVITGAHHCYFSPLIESDNQTTYTFRNVRIVEKEAYDKYRLNGSVIAAKSITAEKVSVSDLVAFDATIGGFNITDNSIYSGVKESVDNTTRGIYLNSDGECAFGDSNNFLKYYKDSDGNYHLAISADSLEFSGNKSVIGGRNLYLGTRNFDGDRWTNMEYWETREPDGFGYREYGRYGSWMGLGQNVEAKAGETYTFSFYARGDANAEITVYNAHAHTETTPGSLYIGPIPDEYIRYHFTFTVNEDCTICPRVENMTEDGWIQIYGLKLEKGSVATDWTPAPEDADSSIEEAGKTATNFMQYDATNGLQLGNKISGSWSGFRARITNSAYDILDAVGTVLASYGASLIELGKNSVNAIIKLCGGKGTIQYNSDEKYLDIMSDSIRLKGTEMSSVEAGYTSSSGVKRNSAVHVSPTEVNIRSGINRSGAWDDCSIRVTPDGTTIAGSVSDNDTGGDYESFVEGTSGIWSYRQWKNGRVELWGEYYVSTMSCSAALGNWYRTTSFAIDDFPFMVYEPKLVANYESTGYGGLLWPATSTSTSSPPQYYLIRPTSGNVNGTIYIHVVGRWT